MSHPDAFSPSAINGLGRLSSSPFERPHKKGGHSARDVHRAPGIGEPNGRV